MSSRESNVSAPVAAPATGGWLFGGLVILLLFAPLVFWRELYDGLSVPKRALIQVGALVLLGLAAWQRKAWRWPQPLGFFTVLFLLWALVSLTWATNPWLGWWTWWQWLACALIGWVVLQVELTPERLRALLWAMAGSGALVAIIGLAQAWCGWAWVPQAIAPGATLANRNMAAQVMVLVIPIAAVLVYLARCRREVIMATIALTLSVTFLGHTFTKGCWIAFGFSALLAGALGWRCGWRSSFRSKKLQALLMAAGIAALAINVTNEGVRWRWAEIGAYLSGLAEEPETNVTEADRLQAKSSRSVAVRTIFWRNTLVMIREQPVLGVGLNNWRVAYPAATLQGVPDPTLAGRSPERTHNDLLQIWAELGTVGLGLALVVVGLFLREAWRGLAQVGSRDERVVVIGALAALGAIGVDSLFSFPLDREVPPLFGAVLVGIILQMVRLERNDSADVIGEGELMLQEAGHPSPRPSPLRGAREVGALVADSTSGEFEGLSSNRVKFYRVIAVVVFAGAVGMGVWHQRQWVADGFFKEQLAAVRKADWNEVVRLGERIKKLDPTRMDAWRFTGRAQEQLGNLDEAWMDLNLALRYAPDDTQLLHYSALTAQKRGHYRAAEEAWQRAAAILPQEALFPHHLGLLYLAQRDAPGAIRELQRAAELNPQDATVHFNLGLAYELAGNKAEAVASYRKAGELRPHWEEAEGKVRSLKE